MVITTICLCDFTGQSVCPVFRHVCLLTNSRTKSVPGLHFRGQQSCVLLLDLLAVNTLLATLYVHVVS